MSFEISNPVKIPYQDIFELVIEYGHGDGDAETYTTHFFDSTEDSKKEISDFLEVIMRCINFYMDNGKGGYDDYDEVEGVKEMSEKYPHFNSSCDITFGEGCPSVDWVELFYYDINGVKHFCEIKELGAKYPQVGEIAYSKGWDYSYGLHSKNGLGKILDIKNGQATIYYKGPNGMGGTIEKEIQRDLTKICCK